MPNQRPDDAASITIKATDASCLDGLWSALDAVARERRHLAFLQAPPRQAAQEFYRAVIEQDLCQFVALRGDQVIGWCDILPVTGEARAHIGVLGMGLVAGARHQGIGPMLLDAALQKARRKGLRRIELTVRTDNKPAQSLYARFGFMTEGVQRNALLVDGNFYDAYAMALLF